MRTWADASVLLALDAIGEVGLLRRLAGELRLPPEVAAEVLTERATDALRGAVGTWVRVEEVEGDAHRFRALGLGRGEASLFLTPREDWLLLDELPARRLAEAEGRPYVGLLGLLLAAVRQGAVRKDEARERLAKLIRAGFRMTTDLYEEMVREFGG